MSHLSKIFEEAPIKVQNRNGFDLSHTHAGTSKCGQLVPVLTKLLPPNTTVSLGVNAEVNLPPLVAPFYGKIDFAIEGFVVPLSILYGGWKQFISNQEMTQFPSSQAFLTPSTYQNTTTESSSSNVVGHNGINLRNDGYALPVFDFNAVRSGDTANFNTLSSRNENIYDYFGASFVSSQTPLSLEFRMSLMPAIAYHKICDTFYRNTKITRTWFAVNPNFNRENLTPEQSINSKNVSLIWHSFYSESSTAYAGASPLFTSTDNLTFPDGVSVFSTRQRPWMRDYFTSAVPSPQQGGYSELKFSVDTTSGDGSFTISALRVANSLQKFLETNNLGGEYDEMIRNRWGIRPIDADFDEPHYLGRLVIPVYQHTISKNDSSIGASESTERQVNPFTSLGILGSKAGSGQANGEGSICDNFNISTWSYLMCIASLYPHASYNWGVNRELTMTKLGDFPAPELQSVGMEDIKLYEIYGVNGTDFNETFGYIPRYSRFKYMDDRVSGELRPSKTLRQYSIQRNFLTKPQLGTQFTLINNSALDNVLATTTAEMNLTCWWEIYFSLHVVMPLADYCIPTLGELQDTHTIKSTVGGSRL